MYMNYVQRLLFLHSMVTDVMHLAINVYLDGGKPGTFSRFEIKERSRSACCGETFDYRQLLGGGGGDIEFSLTRDAMLEWKLRKTWLPVKLHK